MLDEPVHLAQRLKDSMMPTHMRPKVYVLIRIVNVLTVDAQSVPASSARMLLKCTSTSHDDHLPVTAQFLHSTSSARCHSPSNENRTCHGRPLQLLMWMLCMQCCTFCDTLGFGEVHLAVCDDVGQPFSQVHHK